jgi:hypothetical protein
MNHYGVGDENFETWFPELKRVKENWRGKSEMAPSE